MMGIFVTFGLTMAGLCALTLTRPTLAPQEARA